MKVMVISEMGLGNEGRCLNHDLNGFALYREIKRLDKKVKVCFLTAGEMYYGAYSDIFSSLPANCFIRKPIENQELMNRIIEIIADDTQMT